MIDEKTFSEYVLMYFQPSNVSELTQSAGFTLKPEEFYEFLITKINSTAVSLDSKIDKEKQTITLTPSIIYEIGACLIIKKFDVVLKKLAKSDLVTMQNRIDDLCDRIKKLESGQVSKAASIWSYPEIYKGDYPNTCKTCQTYIHSGSDKGYDQPEVHFNETQTHYEYTLQPMKVSVCGEIKLNPENNRLIFTCRDNVDKDWSIVYTVPVPVTKYKITIDKGSHSLIVRIPK